MKRIETERLVIQPYQVDFFQDVFGLLSDSELMRYFLYGRSLDVKEINKFIEKYMVVNSHDNYARIGLLCRKEDELPIGLAGIVPCHYLGEEDVELSFILASRYQNYGYATEIATRLVQYCLEELKRDRLLALVHPSNAPSRRVLEQKLGMRLDCEIDTGDRGPRSIYIITV